MKSKHKILITGSNGQLGKELKRLENSFPQFNFIFLSREDLPIHHYELVRNFFKGYQPQFLINCAAYTAVDRAESEKELAFQVNGESVGVLAAVCKEYQTKFIHISTDYVFDGTATVPYKEDSLTNPQSVYGASKLEGEKEALRFNPDSIIIRTSWVYSEFGKNFVKTMLKLMNEREELNVVSDQFGSPTYAADLAEAILQIISSGQWHPGIYHYSNEGKISWYEFAVAIKALSGNVCKVNPIPTSQYPTPAKRPAYSVLDKTKIQSAFSVRIKDWKTSLETCLSRLK
ncbi:MAG: dTDP-4-dehydrorhamnose reductase [Chitinophagaceae bacterium]|nr:dTDP-4-dehydrorhamnose reductase [Chitinophagaceae bacterium]HQV59287.1 dTDP-4-dehydrorhamnose reductase [Chitinophagaceae bacterium]HQV85818.1 dTDP-4-dehydrorhamnose reductase [Chitinophagaceae bacterium]HQX73508.1 dTDP-4-dehydrorhamnose reductase [Chitinophagaceae bacterium]